MRMIACSSPVTSGELTVIGMDPRRDAPQIKARLGVVPQLDNLDAELTVRENLEMYARYFDIPDAVATARADELLEFVQLSERASDQVDPLRWHEASPDDRALADQRAGPDHPGRADHRPGPAGRHLLWERLYRLKQRGATLIITTHYMDEAEQLCDRLVVMDKAEIAAEGSPRELIERYSTREVLELRFADAVRSSLDGRLDGLADRIEALPDRHLLYVDDGERALEAVHDRQIPVESAPVRRATLEDVFLRLTGRTLIE